MEVLISLLVGALIMEGYALLNPLTRWLVRRASLQLPEEYRATFVDMVTADVDALPHSLSKLAFVLYNCTVATDAISQEVSRDTLQSVADHFDDFVDRGVFRTDTILERASDAVRRCQSLGDQLVSVYDDCLNKLQQRQAPHAQPAIDRFRESNRVVLQNFSSWLGELRTYHEELKPLLACIRDSYSKVSEANLRLKNRLADEAPIQEDDLKLLDAVNHELEVVTTAFESLRVYDPPKSRRDQMRAAMSATRDAFQAAVRAVQQN